MYSAINPATPRPFPLLSPKALRLTPRDFSTPRAEIPQTQTILSSNEKTPEPARNVLMAAALAYYQAPLLARMFIEEDKKKEEASTPDYTLAV